MRCVRSCNACWRSLTSLAERSVDSRPRSSCRVPSSAVASCSCLRYRLPSLSPSPFAFESSSSFSTISFSARSFKRALSRMERAFSSVSDARTSLSCLSSSSATATAVASCSSSRLRPSSSCTCPSAYCCMRCRNTRTSSFCCLSLRLGCAVAAFAFKRAASLTARCNRRPCATASSASLVTSLARTCSAATASGSYAFAMRFRNVSCSRAEARTCFFAFARMRSSLSASVAALPD
mmetsp:Transcript_377/g.1076  ORF Transcript_377/g.1076 Transcript_377/m.1076 type:complete len:236 (-) Transcript_377:348-1055(-)